ncbi:MAG TPA: HAD-IA family hydrolase [Acidimicrobiales bacterium]|nr:HAD-IA family hydrolase [Acidimicrobiales bacterium]
MLRAVVFDFDGLVVDTEACEFESWQGVYRDHGVELALAEWVACIGTVGGFDPLGRLEELVGAPVDRDVVLRDRSARNNALVSVAGVLPGVEDRLAEAEALGWSVAIASSSPQWWVERHLGRIGLVDTFAGAGLHCRDSASGLAPKPAPDLYLAAVTALGVEPGEAVAFEDSPNGVAAAKAAGLWCVAVPHDLTRDLDLSAADVVVDSLVSVRLADLAAQWSQPARDVGA